MTIADPVNNPVATAPELTQDRVPVTRDPANAIGSLHATPGTCDSPAEAVSEIDLLADPSDVLTFGPDWDQDQDEDDHMGLHHVSSLGLHNDLPDDPLEGLCIPSWHDLLDEAASHLTPEGFPRTRPALTGSPAPDDSMFSAYQAAQGSHQAASWYGPALSESPAQKKPRQGGSVVTWESSRSLSWDHLQDQNWADATANQPSPTCKYAVCFPEESKFARQRTIAQTKAHSPSAEPETVSERLNSEVLQMTMMEIDSAVAGAQQAQHAQQVKRVPKAAAVQKARGGNAKRAKRVPAGRKGQGKQGGANATGHDPASGLGQAQPQGQGKEEKYQGSSLGKLLPFDSLKVSLTSYHHVMFNAMQSSTRRKTQLHVFMHCLASSISAVSARCECPSCECLNCKYQSCEGLRSSQPSYCAALAFPVALFTTGNLIVFQKQ